jgi:hypothetical protein
MPAGHSNSVCHRLAGAVAEGTAAGGLEIGLNAAIISVRQVDPVVLVITPRDRIDPTTGAQTATPHALPFGVFSPLSHRTLDIGLRSWVAEQTGLDLGYVEQLYTFGDRGRHAEPGDQAPHVVSIGYLALTRLAEGTDAVRGSWASWYDYFPWEDWRQGKPRILSEMLEPQLLAWAAEADVPGLTRPLSREERLRICFGLLGGAWDEEKVLERYELLYECGLVEEARRDGRAAARRQPTSGEVRLGTPMAFDHRRILATAIGRLRAKIKYRPVIFEMMAPDFTLFDLQRTVEAILGPHLHKQNFRRLIEGGGLVEPTGHVRAKTGGRPAKLYRFRREVVLERPAPGVRVNTGRTT